MQVLKFKYVEYISRSELLSETKEFIRGLQNRMVGECLASSWCDYTQQTGSSHAVLWPPQVMPAGSAYTVSPTVQLFCLWAALSQAVLLWTFFWSEHRPSGSVTGSPGVWGMALAGFSREFAVEAALSLGLQCLFLSDFIIDLRLEPTHLFLQFTNEVHHSLTDTAGEKMETNIKKKRTTTEEVCRWRPPLPAFAL